VARSGRARRSSGLAGRRAPPYRAFLDPARDRPRERVYVVAISRALDGKTATSCVLPFTVRR
jgi:hypothetical protein